MPTCPYCGATVPDGAIACGNCGASLVSSQPQTSSISQSASSGTATTSWGGGVSSELQARYQKALTRNEQLTKAVAGLSIAAVVIYAILLFL